MVLAEQRADAAGVQIAGSVMEIALLCKVAHAIQRLACIYLFDEDAFRSGKADAELLDLGRYNAPTAKTVCTVQRGGLLEWARHRYAAKLLQISAAASTEPSAPLAEDAPL